MSKTSRKEVQVDQVMYDEFGKHSGIKMGIVTEWWNGEGMDIHIHRKHMADINISLTWEEIRLFQKFFLDFQF